METGNVVPGVVCRLKSAAESGNWDVLFNSSDSREELEL